LDKPDQIIHADMMLPMAPEETVLTGFAVAIQEGLIVDILSSTEARERYPNVPVVDLGARVLMPGLVNAHGHAAMTLLRGLADDQPLKSWLEDHIWPAEGRWVAEDFVRDGTQLAIAEMMLSGTTCFSDMYFFSDVVADCANQAGIRAQLVFPIFEFPSAWGSGPDEYIAKGLQLRDDHKSSARVTTAFGPHAPYTTSDRTLERVAMYAEELDAPVQIHLHEAAHEIAESLSEYGARPIERLNRIGLMGPRLQAVHMTQLDNQDIETVITTGTHVVHCPSSNLKLAAGFCPLKRLHNAGVNIAFGTDGAASNNTLDLFAELRLAALLAKASSGDATALSAHQAIRMATLGGATALGLEDRVGSIEVGKCADLIAVDIERLGAVPVYDAYSSLTYAQSGAAVTDVWIQGRRTVDNRQLQTLETQRLIKTAAQWRDRISLSSSQAGA